MRINPTYGVLNKTITQFGIPRNRFYDGLFLAAAVFTVSASFRAAGITFAVAWGVIFAATYKDPQFIKLFWRASRRKPVLCPWRIKKSAGRRLHV
jgi:hypothetical protein